MMIEAVTGMPYEAVLRKRILDPLGMNDSGSLQESEVVERLASSYSRTQEGKYVRSGYVNLSLFQATGSMYSTANSAK
jgi:CubicO group peptidase (beta-lactamase class C family)